MLREYLINDWTFNAKTQSRKEMLCLYLCAFAVRG